MMEQSAFIGTNSITEWLGGLQNMKIERLFLVRGKRSYEMCGAHRVIEQIVSALNCSVIEFLDYTENPKLEDVESGLFLLEKSNPDLILAIGGGTAIDIAKLIRFRYSYAGGLTGNSFAKERALIPLAAIPTTAGTGAEATHFAVLYKDKVKYSVEHSDVLPDYAIVYPPLTYHNPPYLTACTGFDALAQAIEAYWNRNANEESDRYAEKAMGLLWNNLPMVVDNPTDEARNCVAIGSYWAGRAINITKTTAPHAFSYPYTTYYGYPHGHAVALNFPFFFRYNTSLEYVSEDVDKEYYGMKIDKLKKLCNVDMKTYIETKLHLNLDKPIGYQRSLILDNINMQRLKNNPVNLGRVIKDYQ